MNEAAVLVAAKQGFKTNTYDTKTMSNTESCAAEIIRQIEKSVRKGCVEGVVFSACLDCDTTVKITVPSTHIRVSGSGVRWKTYGSGSATKTRK